MVDQERLAANVDAIYAAARDDFTAERRQRAKQLRADGHPAEAAALESFRKPTVPAWAVNQLVRREPDEIAALLEAAARLGDAQRRATAGRGSTGLREATREVRQRVTALCEVARAVIEEAGARPAGHLDAVNQTLFAAAVDPAHHDELERGIFVTPLEGAGFGGLGTLSLVGAPDDVAARDEPPLDGAADRDEPDPAGAADAGPATARQRDRHGAAQPDTARRDGRRRDGEQREARRQDAQRREAEQREAERREAEQREAEQREAQQRERAEARRRAAQREALEQRRAELRRSRTRQQRRAAQAADRLAELQARIERVAAEADDQQTQLARIDAELATVQAELDALD